MNRTKVIKGNISIAKQSPLSESKKSLPISRSEIEAVKERSKEKLIFSFKFFDRGHDAFNLGDTTRRAICGEWFLALLDNLKSVSDLNRNQLVLEQRQHYQAHEHKWEELQYKYELEEDFLEQVECLQFRLSSSNGRVHGFIIGNRFYVVWLDPHHNLYPDERFGGEKFYTKPLTCYEILEQRVIQLQKENKELNDFINSL